MKSHELFIVDVFAEGKYRGNQLGVVRDAGDIPEDTLLEIARELHFSETAFILSETPRKTGSGTGLDSARSTGLDSARSTGLDSVWPVRIFTPEREVPFAGHPTLGTAFVIREFVLPDIPGTGAAESSGHGGPGSPEACPSLILSEPAGLIPVSFDSTGVAWMRQLPPRFGKVFTPEEAAPTVGLEPADIDRSLPIREVSTGLPFIILPLAGIDAVRRARLHRDSFFRLTADTEAKDILLFSRQAEGKENDLHIRVFTEFEGIPEDPATGSAAGCLCGYLVEHDAYGSPEIDLRGEQGYEINRPSLLRLKGRRTDTGISVMVGGRVFTVVRGTLL